MEQAAEATLQQNPTFAEAVQALKFEIDNDPRVLATVGELQAVGRSVLNSFVPHIKIRVRTEEGIFSLPKRPRILPPPPSDPVGVLTQELKTAASVAIKNSPHFQQLENIVNEAVGASEQFEGIALEVESAGYEVLICLDLSAYVEVRGGPNAPPHRDRDLAVPEPSDQSWPIHLSGTDLMFLKGVGISVEGV